MKYSTITFVTVTTAGGKILSGNPRRTCVTFCSPVVNRVTLSQVEAPTLDNGINLMPGMNPMIFPAAFLGNFPTLEFFGIAATANQVIAVIETIDGEASNLWPSP